MITAEQWVVRHKEPSVLPRKHHQDMWIEAELREENRLLKNTVAMKKDRITELERQLRSAEKRNSELLFMINKRYRKEEPNVPK